MFLYRRGAGSTGSFKSSKNVKNKRDYRLARQRLARVLWLGDWLAVAGERPVGLSLYFQICFVEKKLGFKQSENNDR